MGDQGRTRLQAPGFRAPTARIAGPARDPPRHRIPTSHGQRGRLLFP